MERCGGPSPAAPVTTYDSSYFPATVEEAAMGQTYTILDPYLLMLGRWTRNMARPARSLPHVGAYMNRLLERPAIKRTFEQEGLKAPLV